MRLASYNIEWFNALFDEHGHPLEDNAPSSRYEISRADQLAALGIVFTAINADAVLVIEAPDQSTSRSCVKALENFARLYDLRTRKALIGFSNETQQEVALLYDPDVISARHDPKGNANGKTDAVDDPRFDGTLRMDLDIDGSLDTVNFAKPPLEIALRAGGAVLRLIGVHMKSKAPHGVRNPAQRLRLSIENRRKHLAECIWLRRRVVKHLRAGEPLIVLGDFNDGPGLDDYEQLFGRSGIEIVLGLDGPETERLFDPHAQLVIGSKQGARPTSARFYLSDPPRYFSSMLDYLMVSPDIAALGPRWRIWHPFDDPGCFRVPDLRDALLAASDHFPVSIDLPDAALLALVPPHRAKSHRRG